MERRINLAPTADEVEIEDDEPPFDMDDADDAGFEPEPPRWEMQTPLRGPMAARQPAQPPRPAPQPQMHAEPVVSPRVTRPRRVRSPACAPAARPRARCSTKAPASSCPS